jgi:hypothetical protein
LIDKHYHAVPFAVHLIGDDHPFITVFDYDHSDGERMDAVYREASARKDRNIIKAVPYIVIISAVTGLILAAVDPSDFGSRLLSFCMPFMFGFAALGIFSFCYKDRGLVDKRVVAGILLIIPFIISLLLILFISKIMPDFIDFINGIIITNTDDTLSTFIFVYALMLLMISMSHGVLSTVVAYFRKYTIKIYLNLERIKSDGPITRGGRIARWTYGIPDIIDIDRVELEPVSEDGSFPIRMVMSLAFSIFILGLSISSYIFLNPIFVDTFTLDEAVFVTVIITFFVPVLVIPWFITKNIGAKIKSQARDYYLWKGLRKRLFEGFFAFMMFFSMFAIYVFLGYDIERTYMTYLGYVAITAFLSLLYAFVYANYYHKGFRESIIDDFINAKK